MSSDDELKAAIEAHGPMTDADKEAQRLSFVRGNLQLSGIEVTQERLARAAADLQIGPPSTAQAVERIPLTRTAYLVAVFKLTGEPKIPTFVGVGIFSEPEPTVGGDRRCWTVWHEDDVTFEAAHRHLLAVIRSTPQLAWAAPHLRERDLL
jgi:hypothetical protein